MNSIVYSTSGDVSCQNCIGTYGMDRKICERCPNCTKDDFWDDYDYVTQSMLGGISGGRGQEDYL